MSILTEVIEISDANALPTCPLVSIYMLTYRHEKFIADAIEGVLAQQCEFPIELIIGEDCSPDRTRDIVLDYQKRHPGVIRILTSSKNVGANKNAERCIRAARGKFIAICEGDDYWHHPEKLQMQVDAMQANSGITLCHTDFNRRIGFRILPRVYSRNPPRYLADGADSYQNLLRQWSVVTATSVYKAEALKKFNNSPFNRSDWPFGDHNKALFASVIGSVHYIPTSTATWRKVAGSAGNKGLESRARHAAAVVECREEFLRTYPLPKYLERDIFGRSYRRLMKDAFIINDDVLHRFCMSRLHQHGCVMPVVIFRLERFIMKLKAPHLIFRQLYCFYEAFKLNKLTRANH